MFNFIKCGPRKEYNATEHYMCRKTSSTTHTYNNIFSYSLKCWPNYGQIGWEKLCTLKPWKRWDIDRVNMFGPVIYTVV